MPKQSPQPPKSPAPAAPAGPRYRYYQTPPEKLSLRAGDLLTLVPDAYWVRGYDAEKVIELPAAEVLNGPVPRVSVNRLAELAPECFQAAGEDLKVALPVSRLARSYSLATHSEVVKEPAPLIDIVLPSLDDKKPDEDFAPKEQEDALGEKKVTSRLTPFKLRPEPEGLVPLPPKAPEIKEEVKTSKEAAPETKPASPEPAKTEPGKESPADQAPASSEDSPEKSGPQGRPNRPFPFRRLEANATEGETLLPPPHPLPLAGSPATPEPAPIAPAPQPVPVPPPHAPAKTIFSMLPIFKRKADTPPKPISAPPPPVPTPITKRARVELPPPKIHIAPPTPLGGGEQPLPAGFIPPPPPPPVDPLPKPETTVEALKAEPAPEKVAPSEPAAPVEAKAKPVEAAEPPAAEAQVTPPVSTTPSPAPKQPMAEIEPIPKPEPPKSGPEKIEALTPEPPAPKPLAKASPAVLVETEHLPKKGPDAVGNQDEIQSIFLTEEYLSVNRIVELCGALPGINSCVLSLGASVIASHSVPDSIDLVSLSAHALEMLQAMRESSAKMGIGAVPAVTIHSEKGPITFFHQEDLCLLVLHKDRGFIPGVREKLQQVIDALGKANLPKPLPSSHPATLEG